MQVGWGVRFAHAAVSSENTRSEVVDMSANQQESSAQAGQTEIVEGHLYTHRVDGSATGEVKWAYSLAGRTAGQGDAELTAILALANPSGDVLTFSGGFPAPEAFASEVLGPIAERLMREDGAVAMQYSASEGVPTVRDYLCDRVGALEGRRPDIDELMVTSGGIDCMELLSKSLLDPGDVVVVESPTYLGAIMGFRSYEADIHAVPMDDDGMQVDVLGEWLRQGLRPKFVYIVPEHQNPSGRTLCVDRRQALVALGREYGICVLEDVAYRELSFDGEMLPSLWSMGPDVVVQAGTFSKIFFPGVRLGWAVGPPQLIAQLSVAKQNSDQCAGAFGQRLLEEYGRAGHFDTQLPKARALYAERWALLDSALREHMPDGCWWTQPTGGFFTWFELPWEGDTADLRPAAAEAGVAFVPGRPFYADARPSNAMRLAFSRMANDRIDEGVQRLARVVNSAASARL
jgi:2-aminoadipate transaminase